LDHTLRKVNARVIKEIRLSFIHLETLTAPLCSLSTPDIPYKFLLSEPLYQTQLANILSGSGLQRMPWYDGAGKLFWFYYLEKKGASYVKPKDAWRALVPLESDIDGTISGAWVPGMVKLWGYLYPWGIGLIADVQAQSSWSLDLAVELAFQVRRLNKYDWTVNGITKQFSLNALMDAVIAAMRAKAYGPQATAGQTGEIFSLVTVLDADGIDATTPVENKQELHRALEALTGWSQFWKTIELKELSEGQIEIKQSPSSHVLYGGRRGRMVWFPAAFKGAVTYTESLSCYHQNLMAAILQTESLCRLAQAAAKQLAAGQTLGDFSVTYTNCLRLAVGTLGRLYGGTLDTYRSHSVRDQIKRTYLDSVNAVRSAMGMPALS
jgi:hypothetical protein